MAELAPDLVTDLLRSAWVVEAGRTLVLSGWAEEEPAYRDSAARAQRRQEIVADALALRKVAPDWDLAGAHAEWIRSVAGRGSGEEPLGPFMIARLGDWVDRHAARFIPGTGELLELGEQERASLDWPSSLPEPSPFEPLPAVAPEPPGQVKFTFAVLADLHFGSELGEEMARAAIRDINASDAELVIQLGDITDHGNKEEFELAAETLAGLRAPCYAMVGNHDVFSLEEQRLTGRELYRASFGREPDGTLVRHQGVSFAVLDSAEYAASPFAPFDIITGEFLEGPTGAVVRGSLSPPQHEILSQISRPGSGPAFVFLHHPPQPFTGFPPIAFGLNDGDTQRLQAACESGNVWGVFAGHTHRNFRTRTFGPVIAQEVAAPRDFPFGYALVEVTDQGYTFSFRQLSDQELLRRACARVIDLQRRYALGTPETRGFSWRAPSQA